MSPDIAPVNCDLNFAHALGKPTINALFRQQCEDFRVEEVLGFEPSGGGEHVLLWITKTGQNTHWVAERLATLAGVKPVDVGYCGRKDRHAQCSQWFSIYWPGKPDLDWQALQCPGVAIHSYIRHRQKLRPGMHRANRFVIFLRNVDNTAAVNSRLVAIANGVPNYFGEQRFGHQGSNLQAGHCWALGERRRVSKKQRGMWISALRGYLFNRVLSERVSDDSWLQSLPGDVGEDPELFPTGPLWGRGRPAVSGQTLALESHVLSPFGPWRRALEHCGLSQERRPLVCQPRHLNYRWHSNNLQIEFELNAGEFATSVLREIVGLQNMSGRQPSSEAVV